MAPPPAARYVELQLRLVARSVELGTHDLPTATTELTNLHRRLGFGDPTEQPDARWLHYLDGLATRPTVAEQVVWTLDVAATHAASPPPSAAVARSGPFSVHVHDDVARTHFVPRTVSDTSPLHPTRLDQRREDLRTVLTQAVATHPGIRRVRGTSWLYSTRSYRSVFPAAHVASARPRTGVHRFQGSSAWGQLLDHRGGVKPDLAARFTAALETFDGAAPWTLFPIPTLEVDSPIEVFGLTTDVADR